MSLKLHAHGPETHGTVIIDEDDDEDIPTVWLDMLLGRMNKKMMCCNETDEEMVRAAIEASKGRLEKYLSNPGLSKGNLTLEDAELAHAVSLEQENACSRVRKLSIRTEVQVNRVGDMGKMTSSNGSWRQVFVPPDKCTSRQSRLDVGSSSIQEEAEDVEEQPPVRHRSRRCLLPLLTLQRNWRS
ncbi:Plant UBX domain-containing protein 8 [Camellia lanceoleosa]|uniref:Plant UBX domain-containing protein 8 n=1 Tax=Camellia lanceoleosa TaxID=1840588 RepID=A0ACC0FFY8_9ERIC|nr:Plant UBX domain-containing protein 8 [Camellia lanceoleosa]